jgi:outer membrane protein assembly factor BamB/tetratricopeptide (TPR) repeat protein
MRCFLLPAISLVFATAALRAQDRVVFSGESRAVAGKVEDIRRLIEARKWDAAVTQIQSVLETAGDDLVAVGPDRAVQARVVCHRLLADLPAGGLRLYRARAEQQARKWLEQGLGDRDVRLLRRVVDEAFCTRAAERALDALGDLAFERGQFDEAEHWWRTLTPLDDTPPRDLAYPDPETDPARTRAKQLLARIFRGDQSAHPDELAAYQKLHPDAAGKLAGRQGRYADIVKAVAEAQRPVNRSAQRDWPTFGGDAGRGVLVPASALDTDRLGALCRRPTWRFDLASRERLDDPQPPPQWDGNDRKSARSMAFFPVVAGDKVIVADARTVTAFDLRTGRGEEWHDASRARTNFTAELSLPAPPDLRYTLTVADDCVLARLGAQEVRDTRKDGEVESMLACLDFEPAADGRRLRWLVRTATHDDGVFEGAPVVQAGRVYVAVTRCAPDKTVTAVHCYALEARGTPPLRWTRDVCETREFQVGDRRRRHHLLTLAGPNIVYCSHSGAVVALDAVTGRRAWAMRYPVATSYDGPELPGIDRPLLRDLTPCLYAAGSIFVAPSDSDRLLCLDPATGRTRWERRVAEVVHLLGVGRGQLIFTTGSGLRAVDAAGGVDVWSAPDAGELPPMGRGLLLGDLVLWPTPRGVLLVRQEDGRLAEDPGFLHSVPKGNLAFGHGCLVVADRQTLTVFAPPGLHLRERRNEAEDKPESAEAALELGLAEADAGHLDAAVKSLESAERLARRDGALREEARATRHRVYLTAARRAADAGNRDAAASAIGKAAGPAYSLALRVRAQRLHAEQRERFGDAVGAVAAWQALVEDEELRGVRVVGDKDLPATAGQLATDHLSALLKKHGDQVYRDAEKRAQARFDAAPVGKDRAPALERLAGDFPHAAARRAALRELTDLYSKAGRFAAAAHACDRLRAHLGPDDDEKGVVLRWSAAQQKLAGPPVLPPSLPLFRSWQAVFDAGEGVPSGADRLGPPANRLLFTALARPAPSTGGWLRGRAEATGEPVWQTALPFVPEWLSSHLHLILVWGNAGVAALRLDDGQVAWTFPASASHFREAGGRIFFLEDGRLVAIDIWSGRVIWRREAPGAGFLPTLGCFHTNYYADREQVLIQTASGRRWLLHAEDGTTIADLPTSREPWPATPRRLADDRILLVPDFSTVVVLDAASGRDAWTATVNAPSAISGVPPRVLVHKETVLVLTQTNLGPRLQRLDAATGKPAWSKMPLLDPRISDVSDWAIDDGTVYLPQGNKLVALSLVDGKQRWETTLTGSAASWRIARASDCLLACPATVPEWRFEFRSPLGAVQLGLSMPPEQRPGTGCPVLALDSGTGRVVQRWNLSAGGLRMRSYAAEPSLWPGAFVERVSAEVGLGCCTTPGGLVVTLGGRAWGLRARE